MYKIKSTSDLEKYLSDLGFYQYRTKSPTWYSAYLMQRIDANNNRTVLCILLRKNGIDIRFYEKYNKEILIKRNNFISMHGGNLYRNHYNDSNNFILVKIASASRFFAKNGGLKDYIKKQNGRSYTNNPEYMDIKKKSRTEFIARQKEWIKKKSIERQEIKDWRDICEYVREDCGGYWGDGEWM